MLRVLTQPNFNFKPDKYFKFIKINLNIHLDKANFGFDTQREIPGYNNLMNTVKFVFDHIFRSELSLEELYWCPIFLVTGTRIINHSDL